MTTNNTFSKNGNFILRGLAEEEVSKWANFCAACFSYKSDPPPPSYFERHYYNDPMRKPEWILVAVDRETGGIVSSVRIFRRIVSILRSNSKSHPVAAGGIGEVCTLPPYRRLGLSTMLLTKALNIMEQQQNDMEFSFLHASAEFQPYYAKFGFVAIPSHWSILKVYPNRQQPPWELKEHSLQFREAQFPQDTSRLSTIHTTFSEKRFSGCIIRSEEYWNQYIQGEGSPLVLVNNRTNLVCAWISFRIRPNNRYQVRDFGNDEDKLPTGKAFYFLIKRVLEISNVISSERTMDKTFFLDLHLPTAILQCLHQSFSDINENDGVFDFNNSYTEDDNGWMWKPLRPNAEEQQTTIESPHLIWPVDNF